VVKTMEAHVFGLALVVVIGLLPYLFVAVRLVSWIYARTLRRRHNLIRRYSNASSGEAWALVTGSSSGIGFGFCEELAEAGFNVVLVSRRRDKLEAAAKAIASRFEVETECIAGDLSCPSAELLQEIRRTLRSNNVSVVVNNAGISRRLPDDFHTIRSDELSRLIAVNCESVALISKLALSHFASRHPAEDRAGALVITSSLTASIEAPGMSGYAASKAFDLQLAKSLQIEYESRKIDVMALTPAYVQSKLSGASTLGGFPPVVSARSCARGALDGLGYERETGGHWIHDCQLAFLHMLPRCILDGEILDELRRFKDRKARFLSEMEGRPSSSLDRTDLETKRLLP